MTPEQIELEFEHISYDQQMKKGEVFEDDEYDRYDEETEADDRLLSAIDVPTSNDVVHDVTDQWEDV